MGFGFGPRPFSSLVSLVSPCSSVVVVDGAVAVAVVVVCASLLFWKVLLGESLAVASADCCLVEDCVTSTAVLDEAGEEVDGAAVKEVVGGVVAVDAVVGN
jgi:hypothetical protein